MIFYLRILYVHMATCKIAAICYLLYHVQEIWFLRGGLLLSKRLVAHPYSLILFRVPDRQVSALWSLYSPEAHCLLGTVLLFCLIYA